MSWQEELRKLDEDLASGKLSADDYRVRRDQVLSSAVTQGEDVANVPPAESAQPPQAPAPEQPAAPQVPEAPQVPQVPTPEVQPQNPVAGGGPTPDSTQVISPVNAVGGFDDGPERTQVVPPWQAQQAAQQVPYHQPGQDFGGPAGQAGQAGSGVPPGGFFTPAGPMSPANGFQQQQPWGAQDQAPPWGGSEFPPTTDAGWGQQWGQDAGGFDETPKGGKGKIFAIVGVIVLLAGLGVGAFFLFGQGEDPNQNQNQNQNQAGPTNSQPAPSGSSAPTAAPEPEGPPIGEISGERDPDFDISTFDEVPNLDYLIEPEIEAYQQAQPGNAAIGVFNGGQNKLMAVLVVEVGDTAAGAEQVAALRDIQLGNGAKESSGMPQGVLVTEFSNEKDKVHQYRAHYMSGDYLVRVEGFSDQSLQAVQGDFMAALEAQLQVAPADG